MSEQTLFERALENCKPELATTKLQRIARGLLSSYLFNAGYAEAKKILGGSDTQTDSAFEETLNEGSRACKGRISQFPLLSLLTLDVKRLPHHIDHLVFYKLQASLFYALVSDDSTFSFITVSEAADNIRLTLLHRANSLKISQIPSTLTITETLEFLCNEISGQYTVSNAYLRMVRNGWNVCLNLKEELPPKKITSRVRERRPDSGGKSMVQAMPFPFEGNDLDIEDEPGVNAIQLDPAAIAPTIKAERELFRNQILKAKEQFALQYVSYRLTPQELTKTVQWINSAQPKTSSAFAFLTMLTSLKLHEVLGLHVAFSESEQEDFKQSNESYGVINLESGVYWRKELEITDSYQPSDTDLKWLLPHNEWLALPIPRQFLGLLRTFFNPYQAGLIEQILPNDIVINAVDFLTQACREIVHNFGFNRSLRHKVLRYALYGCVVSKYGKHKASLIFANNEFGLSTWHYYMSDTVDNAQLAFIDTCTDLLGFEFDQQINFSDSQSVVGSKLAINNKAFSELLTQRIAVLNASLRAVKKSRSLEGLREIYNQLVSYTVLMFSVVTSHRRNKSMFIEHYCWNDDYTRVLVADKIHFGESATRLIPVPELMTKQIQNTLGWIEQIIKRVRLLDKKMALKLKATIHRDSNASFLGLWNDNGSLGTPSTSQIAVFMGDTWNLPQNTMRHLSYHTLLSFKDAAPFLDHQMGHISTDMHSYQNTSLIQHHCKEVETHRSVLTRCLDELRFSLLGRTSFSHSRVYNKGQYVPSSIQKKSKAQSKSTAQVIKTELQVVLDKATKTKQDFYDLLSVHFSDDPFMFEQALKLLEELKLNLDDESEIIIERLNAALGSYFKKPPVAKAVLPYDVMFSERNYSQIHAAFYSFAEALLTHHRKVSVETLSNVLLFSMILDGSGATCPLDLKKSVTIKSVRYLNGYLTAVMVNTGLTFFGGLSAILLAMLVKKGDSQNICLNPKGLESLMNGRCPETDADKSIDTCFSGLSALFRQMHDKKMTFSKLFQLIEHAPRAAESGCSYGLRQGTLKVKGLSEHTLLRLLDRKHRYIIPSIGETQLSTVAARTFFKSVSKPNEYYKKFLSDFRRKCAAYPGTSKERITSFWQNLVSIEHSKNLADLVKASQGLPEIIVLILTWMYTVSGGKGLRDGGLATSSIQTYFSKLAPHLCEAAANRSLTTFDYEDFIDLYQDIIDAGDIVNRAERARILSRFHLVIQENFGVIKFDFRDLDVEAHEESTTGRLIMPWEYDQALSLLLTDPDANTQERYTNAAILILCCRLALRREEIRRLKLRDISVEDESIYVRTNRIFNETVRLKSKSANRRIPYSLFLNQSEWQIIETFLNEAKALGPKSVPLFFDPLNPKELRHMDGHFSRVIEALKLVTGDPNMRVHDGRHTSISFTSTALNLDDKQNDPIAKVVKEWIRADSFSEFQDRFKATTIAAPSTQHALLPALALMVGHSNATTTLSSYTHLMEYWRWLSVENDFKQIKKLDSTLSSLAKINRKRFTELKNEGGLSASYAVLMRIKEDTIFKSEGIEVKGGDQKPVLSSREQDTITPIINQIKLVEKGLRYLEDAEKQSKEAPDSELIKPSDLHYGLTYHYVEQIGQIFQSVLTNEISYRAYKISSNEEGVDFIGQPRLYEARNYFKEPAFYQLLKHLIQSKQADESAFLELTQVWQQAWYDAKKKLYVPIYQIEEIQNVFSKCHFSFVLGKERINRRIGGVLLEVMPVEHLKLNGETVSIPQFCHAMFLYKISDMDLKK